MSQQQQQENLEEKIRALREKLRAFIADLRRLHEQYKDNPDLQIEQPYLDNWFPNRIREFEEWEREANRALEDEEFRRSEYFFSALNEYDSLGHALDADLESVDAKRGENVFVLSGEMIRLSRELRKRLQERHDLKGR